MRICVSDRRNERMTDGRLAWFASRGGVEAWCFPSFRGAFGGAGQTGSRSRSSSSGWGWGRSPINQSNQARDYMYCTSRDSPLHIQPEELEN